MNEIEEMNINIQDYIEIIDDLNHEQCKKLLHQAFNTIRDNYSKLNFLLDVQEGLLDQNKILKAKIRR